MNNVPKLRFIEFRDSGEWEEKRLGDIGKIITGNTPKTNNKSNYGNIELFVTPGDISDKRYVISTKTMLSEQGFNQTRHIKANSILFVCIGSTIGKVAQNKYQCATNQQINTIIPSNDYSNDFVYSVLEKNSLKIADIAGHQAVPLINKSDFSAIFVNVPSEPKEQQKIADCLSSIDELIETQIEKVEALKNHKKSLMQQLFPSDGENVPKLRFPEFRDSGEWEIKSLKRVAENLDNLRVPITEKDRTKGDIPYYGASGIIDYINDFIFNENLLCISEDGANLLVRTYPIAFSIIGKSWVNNHAHVLRFEDKSTQIIVENYLNSIKLDDFLTGMAQPKLNKEKLNTIPIPLPKPKEQQKIADCLSSLDNLITSESDKIESLKNHKKGLMQQLFPNEEVSI